MGVAMTRAEKHGSRGVAGSEAGARANARRGSGSSRSWARGARAVAAGALAVVLAIGVAPAPRQALAAQTTAQESFSQAVQAIRTYAGAEDGQSALTQPNLTDWVGQGEADWIAYEFARTGAEGPATADGVKSYEQALQDYVSNAYQSDPDTKLSDDESTSWSRTAIVAKGLGGDPTDFGTDADGNAINLLDDGVFDWSQTNDIGTQGVNAYIYALYAIDCTGAQAPDDAKYTTEGLVQSLLSAQSDEGWFGLTMQANAGDSDITSMAVVALSQHTDIDGVQDAIDSAMSWLSQIQGGSDGGFSSGGLTNAESCAMVTLAVASQGRDPATDTDFVKNGHSVLDALLHFQNDDGSFRHSDDQIDVDADVEENIMPTEQAMRALAGVLELEQGGDGDVYTLDVDLSLQGTSDAAEAAAEATIPWLPIGIIIGIGAAAVVTYVVVRHRNRHFAQ